jgi:PleD family two-component response regulator
MGAPFRSPDHGAVPVKDEPAALSKSITDVKPACERLRILIVEDNRVAADSLRVLLELLGHEVTVAYSGPEGVTAARACQPEIVLCDIGLPGFVRQVFRHSPARLPRCPSEEPLPVSDPPCRSLYD